jgi:hypothetical protein
LWIRCLTTSFTLTLFCIGARRHLGKSMDKRKTGKMFLLIKKKSLRTNISELYGMGKNLTIVNNCDICVISVGMGDIDVSKRQWNLAWNYQWALTRFGFLKWTTRCHNGILGVTFVGDQLKWLMNEVMIIWQTSPPPSLTQMSETWYWKTV